MSVIFLFLNNSSSEEVTRLAFEVIMDFQCVENYLYPYLTVTFLPSCLFIVKIWLN